MENEMMNVTEKTPIEVLLKIDNDGFTTARNLYEFLELDVSNYSKWCKRNIENNPYAEENIDYIENSSSSTSLTGRGNYTDYKISSAFAKKLAMTSNSTKGEEARCYFVACEQILKQKMIETQKWEIERAKGIMIRHILTDTIKLKIADSPNKKFTYPNYTKLIYKILFNKSYKEMQAEYGLKPKESLRECLNAEELKQIESAEMLVSSLINCGWGYSQIKTFLETNLLKRIQEI